MTHPAAAGQATTVPRVAALLVAQGRSLVDVERTLTSTARQPLTEERGLFTPVFGYGIVDAEAAVAAPLH